MPELFTELAYGFTLSPNVVLLDHSVETPDDADVERVGLTKGCAELRVVMRAATHSPETRAAATLYAQRFADYLSLKRGALPPVALNSPWCQQPGKTGRMQFGSGRIECKSHTSGTLTPDPAEQRRYLEAGPAQVQLLTRWPSLRLLSDGLRESAEVGGGAGLIVLFDCVKEAAGKFRGAREAKDKHADEWILKVAPSTKCSAHPRFPKVQESCFARARNDLAHGADRRVRPIDAAKEAARILPKFRALVANGLRREIKLP